MYTVSELYCVPVRYYISAPTNHTLTFFSAGIEMRCSVLVFAVCYVVNVDSVGKINTLRLLEYEKSKNIGLVSEN